MAFRNKTSKEIVYEIRKLMGEYAVVGAPIQAYIIPCTDEHQVGLICILIGSIVLTKTQTPHILNDSE